MLAFKITYSTLKTIRKLSRSQCVSCCQSHFRPSKALLSQEPSNCRFFSTVSEEDQLEDSVESKIIYNSVLHKWGFLQRKKFEKLERKNLKSEPVHNIPVSLKFISDGQDFLNGQEESKSELNFTEESPYTLSLPFKLKSAKGNVFLDEAETEKKPNAIEENNFNELISDGPSGFLGKWMNDYEKYSEETEEEEDGGGQMEAWRTDYGSPDPLEPVSRVPCGGCGASLHCREPSIPGYLPSEIFKNCDVKDLREIVCQRCHFLKNYNTALSVSVNPDDYPRILSQIKDKKALVLLLADLTDLPCSIWPRILDVIGGKQPVFLVGNKVDLLPGDGRGWSQRVRRTLQACLPGNAAARVKHTALISARTGFGIEELINKLHNFWQYKGDVYLVGCTNVGKSTLFNALLQSDYCKVKAVDLIQRATTAPWPGTTLNLLKFPILRPEGWRLYARTQRLQEERRTAALEKKLRREQKMVDKRIYPQLMGHIGRTFAPVRSPREVNAVDSFGGTDSGRPLRLGLNPDDPDFALSKWLYDTPGVLTREQCLDLLTTEEVTLTVPRHLISPRSYVLRLGWSLLLAGLARIDYLSGTKSIILTIFSAESLPVTIVREEVASEMYERLLGTEFTGVPRGPLERLQAWPGLTQASQATFIGLGRQEACADVTLSSAGWVSVTPDSGEVVKLGFWTPEGRGVHVRSPAMLPHAVALRGRKVEKLPIYQRSRVFTQ